MATGLGWQLQQSPVDVFAPAADHFVSSPVEVLGPVLGCEQVVVAVVLEVQHLEGALANFAEVGGQVHGGGVARPDVRADKGAEWVLPAGGAGVEEDAAAWA